MPVYRGGAKFARALASIRDTEFAFRRIIISLNSPAGSPDEEVIQAYQEGGSSKIDVIQTGSELPWMAHQYFWLKYLEDTGESSDAWVFWFAHDDQIRNKGISALTGDGTSWPLESGTTYLGPWGMRYDPPGELYDGPSDAPLESWTSFPLDGPLRLPAAEWIAQQLYQPTYINMSGCVTQLHSFQALRDFPWNKPGGMRIEMATAASPKNRWVAEFPEPLVTTHVSPTTDRTTYADIARKDDRHMVVWLMNYLVKHPRALPPIVNASARVFRDHMRVFLKRGQLPPEDWRRRTVVDA